MKLKQIEEIATKKVPVWQPVLLATLLLAGFIVVPLITQKISPVQKTPSISSLFKMDTIKELLTTKTNTVMKPLASQLQKEAGVALGIAQQTVQQTVQDVASKSAEQAKTFVFDNTLGKVLQNIHSLPASEQDLIKKAICK